MSVKSAKLGKEFYLEKEWLSCRDVLWYLVFCGFAINYMLRINLSLAIVAMVEPRAKAVAVIQCSQQAQQNSVHSTLWMNASLNISITEHSVRNTTSTLLELSTTSSNHKSLNRTRNSDRFSWDEYEQGLVLGGYYWLYWAVQVPGGLLARRYGTKIVFGFANLSAAIIGFLLPAAAGYHLYVFIFLRVLQGVTAGWVWSAMHNMTSKWIPPNEMGKFISSYFGSSIGAALTYPLSASLVNWFGWSSVFYVTSLLGVMWSIVWFFLAYDTPQEHPRISNSEKTYILESLGNSVNYNGSHVVPWKKIFTSSPVWVLTVTNFGATWGIHTLLSEAPTYFHYIHGWNIGLAGFFSAVPHVVRMVFSYVFSIYADWILRTKRLSKTNLRKFVTVVTNGVQGFLTLGLAFSGCHSTLAIIFMTSALTVNGAASSGIVANSIDLSPNYGSILIGIVNTFTATAGFISPMIIGYLTENNQTIEQWRLVFIIAFLFMSLTCVLYTLFGTADLQTWNDAGNDKVNEELQKLKSNVHTVVLREDTSRIAEDKEETSLAKDMKNSTTMLHN